MAKSRKRFESDTSASSNQPAPQSSAAATAAETSRQSGQPTSSAQQPSRSADDYRERVAQRAYELYLSRGGAHGSDWEDWLAAEREVVANRGNEEPPEE